MRFLLDFQSQLNVYAVVVFFLQTFFMSYLACFLYISLVYLFLVLGFSVCFLSCFASALLRLTSFSNAFGITSMVLSFKLI